MMFYHGIVTLFVLVLELGASRGQDDSSLFPPNMPENGRLNFTGLATKYGLPIKEYDAVTDDGYILKVFRIPGDRNKPIFLMHGVLASSDNYLLRGNNSLVALLARAGYDVWLGNVRGNRYSRRHVTLNPDTDKSFWDFSIDEHALSDLPAMLDLVLEETRAEKLSVVNFSQGSTIFFALCAAKPEYNNKIQIIISMAPICFLQYLGQPLLSVALAGPIIIDVFAALGIEEILGFDSTMTKIIRLICTQGELSYDICARIGMFAITGADEDQFEPNFLPTFMGHVPAGTSRKNLLHFAQLAIRGVFGKFDYGILENQKRYNSLTPPVYDVTKVTTQVALLVGKNDRVATVEIGKMLNETLPNVVSFKLAEPKKWMHFDFPCGREANVYAYAEIMDLLKSYAY